MKSTCISAPLLESVAHQLGAESVIIAIAGIIAAEAQSDLDIVCRYSKEKSPLVVVIGRRGLQGFGLLICC